MDARRRPERKPSAALKEKEAGEEESAADYDKVKEVGEGEEEEEEGYGGDHQYVVVSEKGGVKKKKVVFGGGGSGKRGSGGIGGGGGAVSPPRCRADKCAADLTDAKRYHRRHRVCELHAKASAVIVAGLRQRFCQQCSRSRKPYPTLHPKFGFMSCLNLMTQKEAAASVWPGTTSVAGRAHLSPMEKDQPTKVWASGWMKTTVTVVVDAEL